MRTPTRLGLFGALLAVLGATALAEEPWAAPTRAAKKKNPIASDEKSIAIGREIYTKECLTCHGSAGKGDGPAAKDLERSAGDLSSAKTAAESDGALFWKTTEGLKPMPSFAKLLSDDQRWHVVNYLRTLMPRVETTVPELIAPDAHRAALSALFSVYCELGKALVKDDVPVARKSSRSVAEAVGGLAKLATKDLDEKARPAWDETRKTLESSAKELEGAEDLGKLRHGFHSLSQALIRGLSRFGHTESSPIRQFLCPTTFDGAGAPWLQVPVEAQNPYLGSSKPTCGRFEKFLGAKRPESRP